MTRSKRRCAANVVVFDFETTGLSPQQGDRAIEIGAVKLVDGRVVDRFQSLMHPGRRIPAFIESYTGISNAMIADAPACGEVMQHFAAFIDGSPLVAHNASFDQRFLDAEYGRVGLPPAGPIACSMLIARRLYQEAPNHTLGTLVEYKSLPNDGTFHRALADAEMTAYLWLTMLNDIAPGGEAMNLPFSLLQKFGRQSKANCQHWLATQMEKLAG